MRPLRTPPAPLDRGVRKNKAPDKGLKEKAPLIRGVGGVNAIGEGLLKKLQEALWGFALAFEVHSPLEGESEKPSEFCEG